MGKINYGRVVLGGIVAGIVFLLTDWVGMMFLPFDWQAWIQQYNLTEPPFWMWIIIDLLLGILVVWLYAAIRPRFGAGAKTAVIGAVFLWLLFGVMYWGFFAMGLFPTDAYWAMAGWGLVQVVAATVAGAWLYKEDTAV